MRLFVAVDPGAEARAKIASAIELGRKLAPRARWVRSESLHLTLFFLGHADAARVDAMVGALGLVAAATRPSAISLAGASTFGSSRAPKVLFAPVTQGNAQLAELQAGVSRALVALGFAAEERGFTPHLTLARAGRREGDPELDDARQALETLDVGSSRVDLQACKLEYSIVSPK